RDRRAALPRVCRDAFSGDSRFAGCVVNDDADDVFATAEAQRRTWTTLSRERASVSVDSEFVRTKPDVGAATSRADVARAADHDWRERVPALDRAERIFPAAGHGPSRGRNSGRAGFVVHGNAATDGPLRRHHQE